MEKSKPVRVVVRFRPLIETEDPTSPWPLTIIDGGKSIKDVHKREAISNFDCALGAATTQEQVQEPSSPLCCRSMLIQVFLHTSSKCIANVVNGYVSTATVPNAPPSDCCCRCRLQLCLLMSGGGKTYSMVGGNSTMDSDLRGIIPRTCQELYRQLAHKVQPI